MPRFDKNRQRVPNRATSWAYNHSAKLQPQTHLINLACPRKRPFNGLFLSVVFCAYAHRKRVYACFPLFRAFVCLHCFNDKKWSCARNTVTCQKVQTEIDRTQNARCLRIWDYYEGFVATVVIPDTVFIRRPLYIYSVGVGWHCKREKGARATSSTEFCCTRNGGSRDRWNRIK